MTHAAPRSRTRPQPRRRWGLWGWLLLLVVLVVGFKPLSFGVLRLIYPYPYRDLIEQEADRYGLDPLFVVAVIRTESGFSPTARSRVGARGLMQLMPSTAAWVARKAALDDYSIERIEEPAVNVRLGCWYLSYLDRQFPGETDAVLAAYNAGQGNVARWRRHPDAIAVAFPETRKYVKRGIRTYRIYRMLYGEGG
ncbi:MAG TPA: lytic transglycosylase domain-containing protein [Stenomitos sp.]